MSLSTQPYKGARDFYPEDKRLQKYMFGVIRTVVERYGYEEYDAPLLEPLELYLAKTGDEIVNEQTYTFEDRGGRKVAIRPEMTPTVSRMVAGRRQELAYPVRWYNIGSRWRYERPQRGRYREFFQLDVDIFGLDDLAADIEIIQVADSVMQAFGAQRDTYSIRLNSRKFMDYLLKHYIGLSETQTHDMSKLIDRMHKTEPAQFETQLKDILGSSAGSKATELLDILKVQSLESLPAELKKHPSVKEITALMAQLSNRGVTNVLFEPAIMRGFDYYTDIVFEVFDNNPNNNRSMFGGGRYDGLVELFGVEAVPTVGFAMGDATLQNFLEVHDLLPSLKPESDAYVVLIGDVSEAAQPILNELREHGLNLAVDYSGRKAEAQIKSAVKRHLRYILFIGEKELESGQYILKNLDSKKEDSLSVQGIVKQLNDTRKK